jgi:alpha-galactosidase
MNLKQSIEKYSPSLARKVVPESTGFIYTIKGARLKFEGIDGDGRLWRDSTNTFELQRQLQQTPTGLRIHSTIRNISKQTAPRLTSLESLNVDFDLHHQQWLNYSCKGGVTDWWVPPQAYKTNVSYGLERALYLQSHGAGRSSNDDMPLMICVAEPLKSGFFFGMEWSGEWVMKMEQNKQGGVTAAVFFKSSLELEAGEEVELPIAHLGFFAGGFDEGTNAIRRHIYEQVCPSYMGKPTLSKVSYDSWFGIMNGNNIEVMKKQADRAAELGVEVFVHDAAWFAGGFPNGIGNWDEVDRDKFPNGLEELADYVRGKGMDFGLWLELERAVPDSNIVRQRPELFEACDQWSSLPFGGATGRQYHLNLALPAAQDWMIDTIAGLIEQYDLRWSRFDYNIEPNPFWKRVDPTGQIQFDYMKGLYRVLDTLMARYPQWMVETCSSGGRRFDLGMIRRAHTCWFSDHTDFPAVCRHMQARANRFLPGNLLNSSVAVHLGKGDEGFDDTAILSRMLGKLAFDGDIASWSAELTTRYAQWVQHFKSFRHLLVQDFHQLTPAPTDAEGWDVMSFHAYDASEVVLFAFSGRSDGDQRIQLRSLDSEKVYTLTTLSCGFVQRKSGSELMNEGLRFELSANSAEVWVLS